jgi:hypothetical protein
MWPIICIGWGLCTDCYYTFRCLGITKMHVLVLVLVLVLTIVLLGFVA